MHEAVYHMAQHRRRLIALWGITAGQRVLEIGCGQGYCTTELARTVGPGGFVHGVDMGEADYGAPQTLGQARAALLRSDLGPRLRIDLETDFLLPGFKPEYDRYDIVVFAHCAFYMDAPEVLMALLRKARTLAPRLALAEWDIRPKSTGQLAHASALQIQALAESYSVRSESNIRTLFLPDDLLSQAEAAGWRNVTCHSLAAADQPDALWECDVVVREYAELIKALPIAAKTRRVLRTQIDLMAEQARSYGMEPLDVTVLTAGE